MCVNNFSNAKSKLQLLPSWCLDENLYSQSTNRAILCVRVVIISLKSLIGFIGDVQNLEINWSFLILFTFFSVIGVFIGQLFSENIAEKKLKVVFGLVVILIGLSILFVEII